MFVQFSSTLIRSQAKQSHIYSHFDLRDPVFCVFGLATTVVVWQELSCGGFWVARFDSKLDCCLLLEKRVFKMSVSFVYTMLFLLGEAGALVLSRKIGAS